MSNPPTINPALLFARESTAFHDDPDNYVIGGYHPAYIGEIFNDRYVAMRKLFQGKYSSVWLAKDLKHDLFVSLKIYKSAPCYNDIAIEELEVMRGLERKAQSSNWLKRLRVLRNSFDLPTSISASEHFCVRLA